MASKSAVVLLSVMLLQVCVVRSENERVLYLLNVQPYPDDHTYAGWDRGLELIPAGHLAIEQINNRSDVIPGFQLELIDIPSEACGIGLINSGLVNFYRHLVDPNYLVVGVVGLFCSTVTATISPLVNHMGIDYVQMAGSTSPMFRNVTAYPQLFHTISLSAVFNEAVIRLMASFNWQMIGLVHSSVGTYFISTANDFANRIKANSSLELLTRIPSLPQYIPELFTILRDAGARIIFTSLTVPEGAALMCEAYTRGFLWPGYVYVFYERTVQELLDSETACDRNEILEAIEGIFLLQYRLQANPDQRLVSGWTYKQYHEAYLQQLAQFADTMDTHLQDNIYATVLHDQVWAVALAINNSLETFKSLNVHLMNYGFGQSIITDTIADNLDDVSFQGASGYISFNSMREVGTSIDIFQVQGGQPVLVGVYNPNEKKLAFNDSEFPSTIPADRFEVVYEVLPHWLMIIVFFICGLSYVMTTVILVLFLHWRNKPEIKATSPYLCLIMFVACYLLYTATMIRTVHRSFIILEFTWFSFLCNVENWLRSIGINLIFGTLLMKLLRIYHVFRVFRKTSKLWSDQFLFLGVLLICSGLLLILILRTTMDTSHLETTESYVPFAHPPYYKGTTTCHSNNLGIWLTATLVYNGIIIVLVMFLAIQTRHVKRHNFKDTKKVNAYIFTVVAIIAIAIPLWYILSQTQVRSELGGHIAWVIGYLSISILCQLFLFAPKTLPLLNKHPDNYNYNHLTSSSYRESQFTTPTAI